VKQRWALLESNPLRNNRLELIDADERRELASKARSRLFISASDR
jgi:hypothetical protein